MTVDVAANMARYTHFGCALLVGFAQSADCRQCGHGRRTAESGAKTAESGAKTAESGAKTAETVEDRLLTQNISELEYKQSTAQGLSPLLTHEESPCHAVEGWAEWVVS